MALRLSRPLVTSQETYSERRTWLVRITDNEGRQGLGEAAPLPGHGGEAQDAVEPALAALAEALARVFEPLPDLMVASQNTSSASPSTDPSTGVEQSVPAAPSAFVLGGPEHVSAISAAIRSAAPDAPCARAGIELALCDLAARQAGLPLAQWLSVGARDRVPLNATIGAEAPDVAAERASAAVSAGYRAIKVKVGTGDEADIERLAAVRAATGPDIRIRGDANGAWDPEQAEVMCRSFEPFGLEYLEQPVSAEDVAGLAALRAAGIVPIAADEALLLPAGPESVHELSAADVWVLKPSLIGGPLSALDAAALARDVGAMVVITSALDSAVGRAGAAHVAAALPLPSGSSPPACGLATGTFLAEDVADGFVTESGELVLPEAPGLGLGPLTLGEGAWRAVLS